MIRICWSLSYPFFLQFIVETISGEMLSDLVGKLNSSFESKINLDSWLQNSSSSVKHLKWTDEPLTDELVNDWQVKLTLNVWLNLIWIESSSYGTLGARLFSQVSNLIARLVIQCSLCIRPRNQTVQSPVVGTADETVEMYLHHSPCWRDLSSLTNTYGVYPTKKDCWAPTRGPDLCPSTTPGSVCGVTPITDHTDSFLE